MSKSSKTKSGRKATETLTDDAIVTSPKMKRRKLLTIAGHGVVGAAAVAVHFDADHTMAAINFLGHGCTFGGLVKGGPAAAGIILGF